MKPPLGHHLPEGNYVVRSTLYMKTVVIIFFYFKKPFTYLNNPIRFDSPDQAYTNCLDFTTAAPQNGGK